MLNKLVDFIKKMFTETEEESFMNTNVATIVETNNGFGLFTRNGMIAEYSRARDAKRGAARRGFILN